MVSSVDIPASHARKYRQAVSGTDAVSTADLFAEFSAVAVGVLSQKSGSVWGSAAPEHVCLTLVAQQAVEESLSNGMRRPAGARVH
jgi:hypothetical protein